MFKSTGLAKMFAGHRKFFRGPHAARGPHARHLCSRGSRGHALPENLKILPALMATLVLFE